MRDGKQKPKEDRGEQSFIDPKTGKTHVVQWTFEESSDSVSVDPASVTIASTGLVALWKFLTFGAGLRSFRIVALGLPVSWIIGWKTSSYFTPPLANAFGLGLLWSVIATCFVRLWRIQVTSDLETEDGRRFRNVNTILVIVCGFLVAYLHFILISHWIPQHGLRN